MEVDMDKVVITILQGSVVAQTVLGGAKYTIFQYPVTNFMQVTCAKNYQNWLRVDLVIAMKTVCSYIQNYTLK